jgi:CRP/FNR family transcriptional regulator
MVTAEQISRIDHLFPVLGQLPESDRRLIFQAGQVVELPEDQMLMQQNQQCQFIPFVLSGMLRIYKLSPNGREMTLYRTGPGETCLASIACQLKGEDFPALAQVQETATLFMVPVTIYHDVLDRQVVWKDFLITSLYGHLTETMQTLEAVAFDRTDHRLVQWLLEQTKGKVGIIRCTHEAVAIELGTAREVVSRLLGELKNQDAVVLGRSRIEVVKPDLLRQILTY